MLLWKLVLNTKPVRSAFLACFVTVFSSAVNAYDGRSAPMVASDAPKELQGVGLEEKLGDKIDLSVPFKDENNQDVNLGMYFDGKHPVIISPVYFTCAGLCNLHLNGLTDALNLLDKDWSVGKKFKVVALSFDSKETPEIAATKKELYMKLYNREGTEQSWHFLTGSEESVQKITQALGFKFKWDEGAKDWAHSSAAIIMTPDGRVSRYLPGITFNPQDVKLALNEATSGKIGSFVEGLVLYCFKYDPHQSKYSLAAFNVMQLGGGVMVLVMGLWLLPVYIRSRKKNKTAGR